MDSELERLQNEGWVIPLKDKDGIFTPMLINEELISFPSESFSGGAHNDEASGFWATQRANLIAEMLGATGEITLWEIGAGNGSAAIPLRNLGLNVIPVEPLRSGAVTLAKNGFITFNSTLESLELPNNSIDAIGAFDVLEHLEKPEMLLKEIHRVLKPGGTFICSVPAYQWLLSDFDLSIGHFRRYSRQELRNLLMSSSLEPMNTRWLFGFLVLPALVFRRLPYLFGRRRNFSSIKNSNQSKFDLLIALSPILKLLAKFEHKIELRFGLSLLVIARKV
jgi:SAM-dependent methyltransferase